MRSVLALVAVSASSLLAPSLEDQGQLWSQLEACPAAILASSEEARPGVEHACSSAAQRLLSSETVDEARVWRLLEQLPADSWLRRVVVAGVLDRRVRKALQGVPEPSRPPREEGTDSIEQQLEHALSVYRTVRDAAEQRVQAARGGQAEITYQSQSHEFERVVLEMLQGGMSLEAAEAGLARFTWGSWCGTGAQIMFGPQRAVVLLAALEDERWLVAAGAAASGRDDLTTLLPDPAARRRLLGLAGQDWELHELGAAFSGDFAAYRTLGALGSERAARLLIAGLEQAREERRLSIPEALHALAPFVSPAEGCRDYGTSSSEEVARDAPEATSDATQQRILSLFVAHAAPDAGSAEAEAASHLLVKLCRPESRAAFRVMMDSPFGDVRKRGLIGLRALGEEPEPPAEPQPVRFRIAVDGRPFASRLVEWEVRDSRGTSHSSRVQSNERGHLAITRDVFVDPTAPVEGISVGTPALDSRTDVWFRVELQAPEDLEQSVPVSVETQRLTVRSGEGASGADGVKIQLSSFSERQGREGFSELVAQDQPLSSSAALVFERLQRGRRYQLAIVSPSLDARTSHEIVLGDVPAEIVVRR